MSFLASSMAYTEIMPTSTSPQYHVVYQRLLLNSKMKKKMSPADGPNLGLITKKVCPPPFYPLMFYVFFGGGVIILKYR